MNYGENGRVEEMPTGGCTCTSQCTLRSKPPSGCMMDVSFERCGERERKEPVLLLLGCPSGCTYMLHKN